MRHVLLYLFCGFGHDIIAGPRGSSNLNKLLFYRLGEKCEVYRNRNKGFDVLSFDGGGTKGVMEAVIGAEYLFFSPLVPSKQDKNILSFSQLVLLSLYIFWLKCVYVSIFGWWECQVDFCEFYLQKLKSKHTSLKKYTNWTKLNETTLVYFSLVLREQEEKKTNISYPSPQPQPQERSREASPNPNLPGRRKDYTKGKVLYFEAFTNCR